MGLQMQNPGGEASHTPEPDTSGILEPEILAAIAAAAAVAAGKQIRIRSITAGQDGVGAWAKQGRILVQTSHNLRARNKWFRQESS